MTSLSEVIRFRASVHKLTDTEFHQFILTLVQKCGRDILITSLFTMFTSGCDRSSQSLETTLNIIKQIIESRKTKPKPASSSDITMQSLPSALIGNLASYLNSTDYCAFSKANRTVYIGCNTPNTLHCLDLSKINDYSEINLAKYLHLRDLSLNLNAFDSFVLPTNGRTVCNRLQTVRLDAGKRTDVNITHFISQNTINTNNVTYLQLRRFGNQEEQNHFPFDTFIGLLPKFSSIQHLCLVKVALTDLPSVCDIQSDLLQLLPHLQRLTWCESRPRALLGEILTAFHSQLKSLRYIGFDPLQLYLPAHGTFSSLEELVQPVSRALPTLILNQILNTAKNLRAVLFLLDDTYNIGNTYIQQLLTTQPLLEHVVIVYHYDILDSMCNAIESGLHEMEHKKKIIRLVLYLGEVIDIAKFKNILFMIAKIVHQLQLLDPEDFMLMIAFKAGESNTDWVRACTDFEQQYSDLSVFPSLHGNDALDSAITIANHHLSTEDIDHLANLSFSLISES
eukprot:885009_1